MTLKKKLAAFTLSAAMVASMTPAIAFAADAPASTPAQQSWVDLYTGMNLAAPTGEGLYDAVSSATGIALNKHYTHIPSVINQIDTGKEIEGSSGKTAVELDGVNLTTPASTIELNVDTKRTTWSKFDPRVLNPDKVYGTDKFTVYPDKTAAGYSWLGDADKGLGSYKDKVYAVTISNGTTTVGALPWIDFYVENGHTDQVEIALNSGKVSEGCKNGATVHRFDAFYNMNAKDSFGRPTLNPGTYTVKVYAQGYSTLEANIVVPTWTDATVTAADVDADATSTKVTFDGLPKDYTPVCTVDNAAVSYAKNSITFEKLSLGTHTLAVTDSNGKYNGLTTTFIVATKTAAAAYDAAANKVVKTEGTSDETFAAYIGAITSVKVGADSYDPKARKNAVKVIGDDGSIDLSKTSSSTKDLTKDAVPITITAPGYPELSFIINGQDQTIDKVSPLTKTLKANKKTKKLKKNASFKLKATATGDAAAAVTFKKISGSKKITVAANGKVTVKKGLKKGTYPVKITVSKAGTDAYYAASKNVTLKVKVK